MIDETNNKMEIIVPDDQLSLAIGRRGQNVRLAHKLTGWQLDIHSESHIAEIRDRAWESLAKVKGMNEFLIQSLYNHGIRSAEDLSVSDRHFLAQFPGMDGDNLQEIVDSAREVAVTEAEEAEAQRLEDERLNEAAEVGARMRELLVLDDQGRMMEVRGIGEESYKTLSEAGSRRSRPCLRSRYKTWQMPPISSTKGKQLIYAAKQFLKHVEDTEQRAGELGIEIEDGVVKIPGEELAAEEETAEAPAEVAAPGDSETELPAAAEA